MSKASKLFTASLISGTCFLAIGASIAFTQHQSFMANHLVDVDYQQMLDNSRDITIKSSNFAEVSIKVYPSQNNQAEVVWQGLGDKRYQFKHSELDNSVQLLGSHNWWENVFNLDYDFLMYKKAPLNLYLPSNYQGNVVVQNNSGSIAIENISAKNLIASNSSGSITLKNLIIAEELKVHNSSGSIRLEQITAAKIEVANSSGGINVINTDQAVDQINAQNSSGSITIEGEYDHIQASTSSGSIRLKVYRQPNTIRATVSSGNVTVRMDGSYTFYGKVSSGSIKIDAAMKELVTRSESTECPYYLKASSGNIYIKPLNS